MMPTVTQEVFGWRLEVGGKAHGPKMTRASTEDDAEEIVRSQTP